MSDSTTGSTSSPAQIVQAAAAHYCQMSNAPGCCIAVYDQQSFGTGGYVYPYGLSGAPGSSALAPFNVTTDTVFEIGSVTKVFTSTLLAVVAHAGGAFLTDTIGYRLNFNHNFSPNPVGSPTLDAIELVQFATHTSGMPDQPHRLKDYSQQLFADEIPSPAVIDWWKNYKKPPPNPACYQYSNIGFVTLGFAVTQMFPDNQGHNYNEMLAQRVTGPLGMTRTGANVAPPAATGCIGHWSKSTVPPHPIVFERNVATNNTAFDLKTTGNDMLIFLAAQLAAPNGPVGPPIAMTQQVQGKYPICVKPNQSVTMGLAWQITQDTQGNKVFAKNGATSQGGFEAVVIFVPDLQCGVAVLSNQYNASGVHPEGISPGATAQDIIAALHPGFALTEPLLDPVSSD